MEDADGVNRPVPALAIRGLELRRGDRIVLRDVNLDVARGEVVALMGTSGSGKTTILRTVAGLEQFQSGAVAVENVELRPGSTPLAVLKELRRKVGLVFQFHFLFEHLTAIQNVCLAPMHAYGMSKTEAEHRGHELLRALGVEHRARALPRELSGGEAQRVGIARTLAVDPPLLLMDEPTASLDRSRREELAALVAGLAGRNRTLIVATHDEAFARLVADRHLSIADGTVCATLGSWPDKPIVNPLP